MYIAIVKQTGGLVEKYQVFPDEAQADAHVLERGGFVVPEPVGGYNFEYCTVDPVAKTLTYDSAQHTADNNMKTWERDMAKTDHYDPGTGIDGLDRGMERHIRDAHGGVAGSPAEQTAYDAKVALRLTKP